MQTDPNQKAEEPAEHQEKQSPVPYKGFINVNEIVEKRRQLRNAAFNVPDSIWDADLNPQNPSDPEQ